jgi:hypothetical protein
MTKMSRRILILIAVLAVSLSLSAGLAAQAAVAQGSMAVMTPASGPPGTTVKASGANWTAGDHIQAEWGDNDSDLGTPVVVASDGTFTDSFAIPSSATQGSHQVLFWDEEGRYFEVANFDVTSGSPTPPPSSCPAPSVSFFSDGGPVGTTFLIAGSNWVPGGTVTSTLPYGSPGWFTGYQTPTVGANGGFAFKETVGTGPHGPTPAGTYTFTFAEKYGGCSLSFQQKFTVTASPAPSCNTVPANPFSSEPELRFLPLHQRILWWETIENTFNPCLLVGLNPEQFYKEIIREVWAGELAPILAIFGTVGEEIEHILKYVLPTHDIYELVYKAWRRYHRTH